MVILSCALFFIALIMFLYHIDDGSPALVGFSLFLGASAICMFLSAESRHSDKKQTTTEQSSQNNTADESAVTESKQTAPEEKSKDATVDKNQYYGKFPRDYPSGHGEKDKWWHDWAVYNTDSYPIICRDGVQIVVYGVADNDGNAKSISVRTRVHPDGKPFTCSESRDPTEEVSS